MVRTMQQAAQCALDVQDACNLSGVLTAFKDIVHDTLWPEAKQLGKGTAWVNQHPICTLFLYKLMALNGHEDIGSDYYYQADKECSAIAAGPEVESDLERARR